jgi:hypothetical protein
VVVRGRVDPFGRVLLVLAVRRVVCVSFAVLLATRASALWSLLVVVALRVEEFVQLRLSRVMRTHCRDPCELNNMTKQFYFGFKNLSISPAVGLLFFCADGWAVCGRLALVLLLVVVVLLCRQRST